MKDESVAVYWNWLRVLAMDGGSVVAGSSSFVGLSKLQAQLPRSSREASRSDIQPAPPAPAQPKWMPKSRGTTQPVATENKSHQPHLPWKLRVSPQFNGRRASICRLLASTPPNPQLPAQDFSSLTLF